MEYNGRVYVYGTNDSQQYEAAANADNNYSKIKTLNCYSSADMVNWTDHGTIAVSGNKGAAKWSANSWAPAVCHKKINGKEKFFLYFANNASSIGVLTADSQPVLGRIRLANQLLTAPLKAVQNLKLDGSLTRQFWLTMMEPATFILVVLVIPMERKKTLSAILNVHEL